LSGCDAQAAQHPAGDAYRINHHVVLAAHRFQHAQEQVAGWPASSGNGW